MSSEDESSNPHVEHEQLETLTHLLKNYDRDPPKKKKISLYRKSNISENTASEDISTQQSTPKPVSNNQDSVIFQTHEGGSDSSENSLDQSLDDSHISIDHHVPDVINQEVDLNSEFSNIDLPDKLPELKNQNQVEYDTSPPIQRSSFKVQRKSIPGQNLGITPLTVITYNIWNNRRSQTGRTKELINKLVVGHKYLPDLICLQEVTPKSFAILQKALGDKYDLFTVLGQPPDQLPYSNLIGINRQSLEIIDAPTAYDFNSQMGRKLIVCQVKHRETKISFYVLNTHLESFEENWSYRRDQMESINGLIKEEKIRNFILVGDFNICRSTEPIETKLRLTEYSDAWVEMGSPQSLKYTYDHQNNRYVKEKMTSSQPTKQQHPQNRSRLDRILYRFKDNRIVVTKLKMLGVQEPHPSDHFGLLAEFMLKVKK